jgi:hypothetical protein
MTRSHARFLPALGLALVLGGALVSACASGDEVATTDNGGYTDTGGGTTTGTVTGGGGSGGTTTTTTTTGSTTTTTTGSGGHGGAGGHGGSGGAGGHTGGAGGSGGGGGAGGAPVDAGADAASDAGADAAPDGGACADQPEVCDGLDNNCNKQIDEGDPGGGLDCQAAAFGECKSGKTKCDKGKVVCVPGAKSPEVCDGKDNNCDGNVDEGNPGGGVQCQTGLLGICATGITTCDGVNGVICKANVTPGQLKESCNGLDDDCNGFEDDNVPQVGQACTAPGQVGICQFGTYSCPKVPPIQLQCDHPAPGTVQESCNGKDDDCNGTIDDPALVNGLPCSTAFPGVCSSGTTLCVGGSQSCVAKVQPNQQVELCNNLDDNCNGQTDEMNPNPACTQQNPNAQYVQTWSCGGGACGISLCQSGHADIDGAPGNGCECASDAYQTACNLAGSASVVKGGSVTMKGKIESASGSDYLKLNFTAPAVGTAYHPKVVLADSAGGQYAMDILTDCNTIAKGQNNETGKQIDTWEQNYNGYQPGPGCCSDNTTRISSVVVRVYRKFGDAPSCVDYTVTATNP